MRHTVYTHMHARKQARRSNGLIRISGTRKDREWDIFLQELSPLTSHRVITGYSEDWPKSLFSLTNARHPPVGLGSSSW